MAQFPAMPLWTDAYLGDTTHLTTVEHGAYLLLLMTMWRNDGSLPNDDDRLAKYARMSRAQWARIKDTIMEFFVLENDRLIQRRLSDELNAVRQHSAKQSNRAKARWLKEKKSQDAVAVPDECRSDATLNPTPNHLSSSLRSEDRRALQDMADWVPSEEDRSYAEQHGLDPGRVLADIQDWAANAALSKRRKRHPSRFWQTWCRRESDKPRFNGKAGGQGPPGLVDTARKLIERHRALENGHLRENDSGIDQTQDRDAPALTGPGRS